ncbi:MAG TPA: HAMP domain-containing sensor histidine kinase [Verrucomicrobiae bacterium]|nr:HAMP domain-containing sensor histidine kinase [Verrucomicrobiae bacterium]
MTRSSLDLTQKVLGALPEHIAMLDESGRIIALNTAWRNFGDANGLQQPQHGLGVNYLSVCAAARGEGTEEARQVEASIRKLLGHRKGAFSLEYPCHGPAQQRWFQVRGECFQQDTGCYLVIAHQNVTSRIQAQRAAQVASEQCDERTTQRTQHLEETLKIAEGLFYYMEHTFRAPLRATHGLSRMLLDQHTANLDATGTQCLHRILDASETMDALINRVLDFGLVALQEASCTLLDLEELLDEVFDSPALNRERGLARIILQKPMPKAWGDRRIVRLVLCELIVNALKYVPAGIVPRIHIRGVAREDRTRVTIQDNGIGIGSESQKRIFRIFDRRRRGEFYSGTGIGLVFAKQWLARIGGEIGVQSVSGKGSCFWVDLPGKMLTARAYER